jgi:SAM-dependent methyltransferase|tara:strand:+ start:1123 stop:2337 length:1215 start_codon:yes stop_codon:yes gene_type:complete
MCDSNRLLKTFSLSPTPPGNDFLSKEELGRHEQLYPLDLYFCEDCYHLQLGHVVSPLVLYQKNYTYVSATSKQFVNHLKNYAEDMIKKFNLKPNSLVIDIGSNDGTCLGFFQDNGMKVLGVDPATEIAQKATKNGVNTIADFFSYNLSMSLREKYGPANFVTSHNACAHIDNLLDIVKGVEFLLDEDGLFVLEVGYFVDVYSNIWFDTIYHEHLDFHTVAPFEKLFERAGMEIIGVDRISPQGGSIRIISQKKNGKFQRDSSVDELILLENELGLDKVKTFYEFADKINLVKESLHKLIKDLKDDNKTIAGFGAPTKATTLMNHFGIDENILDFIVDDNPLKQGLYTPLSHIPVLSADALYKRKPDYVMILAWNFANPIMQMHKKYSDEIGQFILPMPIPQILD